VDASESSPVGEDNIIDDIHQRVSPHSVVPANLKVGNVVLTILIKEPHEDLCNGAENAGCNGPIPINGDKVFLANFPDHEICEMDVNRKFTG
jgi:hypothetical protein